MKTVQNIVDANIADLVDVNVSNPGGGQILSYDSTNSEWKNVDDVTVYTWEQWSALTPAQQQAIPKAKITGAPGVDGPINVDLMTKLWENSSPTSAFLPQTITLSSTDYDFLLCTYWNSYVRVSMSSAIANKGESILLDQADIDTTNGVKTKCRLLTYVTDTSFNVGNGYSSVGSTTSVSNDTIIPYQIYGIKSSVTVDVSGVISDVSTSADKCMMSDGVTSVQDAIEEVNGKLTWGEWTGVSNFSKNNDTWTAPSNGFLTIRFSGAGVSDLYAYVTSNSIIRASIAERNATGGYTFTAITPVHKNEEFTLLTNQTTIQAMFMPIGF